MNRRNKTIEYRNRQIYEEYITHLRNSYDLSEESIRKIVAKQARGAP